MPTAHENAIHYQLRIHNPDTHLFELRCTVPDPDPDGQRFSLPAWVPGSYLIREFARHVLDMRAECNGQAITVRKIDKDSWHCDPCVGPLTLHYTVYAWDLSVRAAYLDRGRAFFNGSCVFLMAHGREQRFCILDLEAPQEAYAADWRVGTAMARLTAAPYGFGRYGAGDYAELIDHPVEMAPFTLATFEACGVPHDIMITGRHHADMGRLCTDLKKICEYQIRLFDQAAPMDRYVFLVLAVGDGYGGLEHRASSSLICRRDHLPLRKRSLSGEDPNDPNNNEGYCGFLGLCSHEYFHTWNVKRIKPAAFTPYDLSRENYTRLLWAFEGITSYYDDLVLRRVGLISTATYLTLLGQNATRVWRGSGRLRQSVAESSFDAWIKFYRQDENTPNAIVSYYAKGSLVALALDLTLRQRGGTSLDELMRALWERYGKSGRGVPEQGVERLAAEISGLDLDDFFRLAVEGVADLPMAEILAPFGIDFILRPAESDSDAGGKASAKDDAALAARPVLGARLAKEEEARLVQVFDGGPAQQAGLWAGDILVALDGLRVNGSRLNALLAAYVPGDPLRVHFFRRDELMETELTLQAAPADTCVYSIRDESDGNRLRQSWLSC